MMVSVTYHAPRMAWVQLGACSCGAKTASALASRDSAFAMMPEALGSVAQTGRLSKFFKFATVDAPSFGVVHWCELL